MGCVSVGFVLSVGGAAGGGGVGEGAGGGGGVGERREGREERREGRGERGRVSGGAREGIGAAEGEDPREWGLVRGIGYWVLGIGY